MDSKTIILYLKYKNNESWGGRELLRRGGLLLWAGHDWVRLNPEYKEKITEDELKVWMNENITYWKVPALIEFIEEVPKNAVGKVQRRALQEADPLFK